VTARRQTRHHHRRSPAAGNRTGHADVRGAFTERLARTFVYDAANRLVTAGFAFPDSNATGLDRRAQPHAGRL